MKNKFAKTIVFTGIMFISLIAAAQLPSYGQETAETVDKPDSAAQKPNRITGVWMTTVTPRNCQNGAPLGLPFQGLITFHTGGTLSEYGPNPMTPFRSPGHGVWAQFSGNGRYSFSFTFFPLTPAGAPVGRFRVDQRSVIDGNELTSTGTFELRDPAGNLLASGCSSSTATPFE